jgi:hypothetical protein
MSSDVFRVSHVHYHPEDDYPDLYNFSALKKRPRVLVPLNRPDLPHLMSKLTRPAARIIKMASQTDHDYVLFGPEGTFFDGKLEDYKESWRGESSDYEVVAHMTYREASADDAAGKFRDDVASGNIVCSVRGGGLGAVDVDLGDTPSSGGAHHVDRSMPTRPMSSVLLSS